MRIKTPANFSFLNTLRGHGWYQLSPFEFDEDKRSLKFAYEYGSKCLAITVLETGNSIEIDVSENDEESLKTAGDCVRRILRLDEPFEEFYAMLTDDKDYSWIHKGLFGPLLRSPTVFEDVVKTICTTNCSWALTKIMTTNLVESLGIESADGKRAFPTAERMAGMTEEFFSKEIRSGYRGPYFLELADAVASGKIEPENWAGSDLTSAQLKKEVKNIKGVGDYAAEHILKLVGRYDGLALDSFLRSEYYKGYNRGKQCDDKKIERHYSRFGIWKGLVIWFDMVESRGKRDAGKEPSKRQKAKGKIGTPYSNRVR